MEALQKRPADRSCDKLDVLIEENAEQIFAHVTIGWSITRIRNWLRSVNGIPQRRGLQTKDMREVARRIDIRLRQTTNRNAITNVNVPPHQSNDDARSPRQDPGVNVPSPPHPDNDALQQQHNTEMNDASHQGEEDAQPMWNDPKLDNISWSWGSNIHADVPYEWIGVSHPIPLLFKSVCGKEYKELVTLTPVPDDHPGAPPSRPFYDRKALSFDHTVAHSYDERAEGYRTCYTLSNLAVIIVVLSLSVLV